MQGAAELAQAMAMRLAQRAREEWASQGTGMIPNPVAPFRPGVPSQVSINPLSNVPLLGGLINRTVAGPLHAAGLITEGAGNVGQAAAGEVALLTALAQVKAAQAGIASNNPAATASSQAALAQGPLHPGRAIEAMRASADPETAWLAGGLEMAANPLNYALPASAAAKAADLPRLAALLKGAGEIGNVPFSIPGMARVAEPAARAAAEAGVTRPLAQSGPGVVTGPARDTNLANFMAGAHPALLNADGSPKVFYHGTQSGNFDQFAIPERPGLFGRGVYLTERPEMADYYAGEPGAPGYGADNPRPAGPAGPNVKPVYVNLKNPLIDKGDTALLPREQIRDYALARGHDGIITGTSRPLSQGGGLTIDELIAFDPAAIKSATGNVGTFDPAKPSLLHAGLSPEPPASNYRTRLSQYADTVYRETGASEALAILDPARNGDGGVRDLYYANHPDLALGQGNNKGVLVELDPAQIEGQVNRNKPGWEFAWRQGLAEFMDRLGSPNRLSSAVRSVVVKPDVVGTKVELRRLGLTLDRLEGQGWAKETLPDGGLRYTPPAPSSLASGLAPVALRAGTGAIGGAGAGAAAFGEGEAMKRQRADGVWVDVFGNETTPPDVLGAGLKGALIGGAGGAAFGAFHRPQAGGDLAAEGDRLAATLGQQADLNLPAPETLGQIAPNLIDYLRGFVKNPATFDPARFRSEALANDAANSLGDFFAQNWPRVQSGKLDRQQLLAALIPTRLSIRRGPVGEGGIAKVAAAYPELESTLRDAAIQGGPDAGKVRPEDIASYLILHTDEGRALARAIDQGDRGALAAALPRFKQVWPGSLMGHEAATFWDTVQHGKLGQATDLINQAGAAGAEPGTITAMLRQGTSDYDRIKGIATGKVPFLAGQLGIASDLPVFDSKVIATLHEGASPAQYKALLEQLYPWAKDDPFRAHQYFWDSVQRDLGGVGAQTPHPGLMAAQEAARQGDLLGANLSPQQVGQALATRGGRAAVGAVAGGLAGGTQGETPEEHAQNALKGAVLGAGTGVVGPEVGRALYKVATDFPGAIEDTVLDPKTLRLIKRQADRAQQAAGQAQGAKLAELPRAVDDFWRNQVVNTFRGLGLDAVSLRTLIADWGRDYGVDAPAVKRTFGQLVDNFDAPNPIDRLGDVGQTVKAWGLDRLVDKETGLKDVIGEGFIQSAGQPRRGQPQLSGPQRAIAGAGLSFANLREAVVPIVGPAWGAFRGHFAPWVNAAYGTANGLQHAAARGTFWQAALTRDLPQAAAKFANDLKPTGLNLDPLLKAGGPVDRAGLEGFLSKTYKGLLPDEVKQIGEAYDGALETVAKTDGDAIAKIFGDFRGNSQWKGFLSRLFPFSSYSITMLPTWGKMVRRNPGKSLAVAGALGASAVAVHQNKEAPWNVGTVPIDDKTLMLGALARARLGGQAGTVRLNPLQLLGGPVPTGILGGMKELPENASGYDKATAALDMVGLSPHPLAQYAAKVTGLSRDDPQPLSRTAGLESAAELLPGMGKIPYTMLPTAQGVTNSLTGKLTGKTPDDYDQVAQRYAQLVLDQTHKPLSDPANEQYLVALGDTDAPLWLQARQEVRMNQLVGGLLSNMTPVSTTATGRDAQDIKAAKADLAGKQPYIDQTLQGLANSNDPALARVMAQVYADRYPQANAYRGASTAGRERILMQDRGFALKSPQARALVQAELKVKAKRKDR